VQLLGAMMDDFDTRWGSVLGYSSQMKQIFHNQLIGWPTISLWAAMMGPCTKQTVSKLLIVEVFEQLWKDIKAYAIENCSRVSVGKDGCKAAEHKNVEKGKTEDLEAARGTNSLGDFIACYSSNDDSVSPTTAAHIATAIDDYSQNKEQPLLKDGVGGTNVLLNGGKLMQ
jgi:hypothetical protein